MVVIIDHYFLIHEGATPLHRSEQVMNNVGGVATQESMDRSISSSHNGIEDDETDTASEGKHASLLV